MMLGSGCAVALHSCGLRHDPSEGMEFDRIKRVESYVKDFKAFQAGNIYLEKGRGPLALKALDITGSKTIDFRQLILNRIE